MRGEQHLTKPRQYAMVSNKGRSLRNNLLTMKVLSNGLTLSRYGFSVSKRVGNAVIRNRVKRLLREILRVTPLKPGWDIVFVARPDVAGVKYSQLADSVIDLLSRARILGGVGNSPQEEIKVSA